MKAEADVGGHVLEIYGTVNQRFHVNELFTQFSPVVSLHVLQTSFYRNSSFVHPRSPRQCNRITEVLCLCSHDLSDAFDTIDHDFLITRLSSWFGIHGSVLAGSSHICHLAASVSNVKPTCPGTRPHAVSPRALSLVHYSSSCTPLLSVPSFLLVP